VPLLGENRILARHGLRILQATQRPGLRALMDVAECGRARTSCGGYFLSAWRGSTPPGGSPTPRSSVELLLSEDANFCGETARQLEAFNRERQDIERGITAEAERMIETQFSALPASCSQ